MEGGLDTSSDVGKLLDDINGAGSYGSITEIYEKKEWNVHWIILSLK